MTLQLGANNIGDDGAKAFGAALAVNGSLTTLSLADNQIGDEGAKAIDAALAGNGSLTSLDLQYNWIGPNAGMIGKATGGLTGKAHRGWRRTMCIRSESRHPLWRRSMQDACKTRASTQRRAHTHTHASGRFARGNGVK